ncbi:SdrD B-like domain-containing protein [Bizionia sp. KMM 8389]
MRKITQTIMCLCMILSSVSYAQEILFVPTQYANIQTAVNAASENDIVIIDEGVYNESINLNSAANNITIAPIVIGTVTIHGGDAPVFYTTAHTGDISIIGLALTSTLNDNSQGVLSFNNAVGTLRIIENTFTADNTNGIQIATNDASVDIETSILSNVFTTFGNDKLIKINAGDDGIGGSANIVIDDNSNTGSIEDAAVFVDFSNSNSDNTLVITNNTFDNWIASGSGIDIHFGAGSPVGSNQNSRFLIDNNSLNGTDGNGIIIDLDGENNTIEGKITNNTITGDLVNTTHGINIDSDSTANGVTATLFIEDNAISNVTENGIYIRPFNDDVNRDIWNFSIKNNTIDNPNSDNSPNDMSKAGILITDSSGIDDENYTVNATITNNTITNLNSGTSCIVLAVPTTTTIATAVINADVDFTSCSPTFIGAVNLTIDPISLVSNISEISGYVWHDENGNGIQDSGEPGLSGIVINYTGTTHTTSGSTLSRIDGTYTIPALKAGNYTLEAESFIFYPDITSANEGTDTSIDSDFNPTTRTYLAFTSTENLNTNIDLGLYENSTLSVDQTELKDLVRVYPNPVVDKLTVNVNTSNFNYAIYSIQGQLLVRAEASQNQIDFSSFKTGMYVLVIETSTETFTQKVIKK